MPTIKTKKQMNLPELIEWIEKNRRFGETFDSNRYNYVDVNVDGVLSFTGNFCEDIFTVEIEEPITEDTVLPKAIAVFKHTTDLYTDRLFSKSINEILKLDDKVTNSDTKTIYVLNNDGTLTLIWTKEKGLVE